MDAYWRQDRLGKVHGAVIQLGTKAWTTAELTINQLFSWSDARRPWQRPRMELGEIKSILASDMKEQAFVMLELTASLAKGCELWARMTLWLLGWVACLLIETTAVVLEVSLSLLHAMLCLALECWERLWEVTSDLFLPWWAKWDSWRWKKVRAAESPK